MYNSPIMTSSSFIYSNSSFHMTIHFLCSYFFHVAWYTYFPFSHASCYWAFLGYYWSLLCLLSMCILSRGSPNNRREMCSPVVGTVKPTSRIPHHTILLPAEWKKGLGHDLRNCASSLLSRQVHLPAWRSTKRCYCKWMKWMEKGRPWVDGWIPPDYNWAAQPQQHCCQSKHEASVIRYWATAWLISHYGEV